MVTLLKSKPFADSFILNLSSCGIRNLLLDMKVILMKTLVAFILFIRFQIFKFACLVSERHETFAELDILFLRPEPAGQIIKSGGGDIDNRLKTLFDGLRCPVLENELAKRDSPQSHETPFHCLLSDDALITKITVATDQLLNANSRDEVVLIIHVRIKSRETTWDSMGFF